MRFSDRFRLTRHDVVQFVEYFIGGSSYFWSGYLVFAICYSALGWDWLPAKIAADIIGWTVNYLIQRYWAFKSPALAKKEGQTLGKYSLVTAANLGLDYLIIWGLKSLGVTPYIGFFISAGFFTVWNYLWYRFFVFYVKKGGTVKEVL
jgi:putative flippase GtrA